MAIMNSLSVSALIDDSPEMCIVAFYIGMHHARSFLTVLFLVGGLAVATFVELLLVPVLYAIFVLDLKIVKWEAKNQP